MDFSAIGRMTKNAWLMIPTIRLCSESDEFVIMLRIRPEVALDDFVIMPDHMHGIIMINDERNGVSKSLNNLVGAYSALVRANCYSPRRETPFRSHSDTELERRIP